MQIYSYDDGGETTSTYTEGHIYKATLPEDSAVCFVSGGQVQGTSVRELNFTIAKADVQNLQLSKDMIYIPASQVSNLTGDNQSGLYGLDVASGAVATSENAGVFNYTSATLSLGDTIAIYYGTHPDQQGVGYALTDGASEDWVIYGSIVDVGKNGNYAYVTPDAEEVLFTPDVIPVSESDDKVTSDGNVFTAEDSHFNFTDYGFDGENFGLDGDTVVEEGDFLAIYVGDDLTSATTVRYGRITSVKIEAIGTENWYTIAYTPVSESEMMEAMDLYSNAVVQEVDLDETAKTVLYYLHLKTNTNSPPSSPHTSLSSY